MTGIQLDLVQDTLDQINESDHFQLAVALSGVCLRLAYEIDVQKLATSGHRFDCVFMTFGEMIDYLKRVDECVLNDESLKETVVYQQPTRCSMYQFFSDTADIKHGLIILNELIRNLYIGTCANPMLTNYYLNHTRVGMGNVNLVMNFLIGSLNEQRKTETDH